VKLSLPELLEPYRSAEEDEIHVAVVIDQDDLMRLCAAWTRIVVRWKQPVGKPPDNAAARWDWIWGGCEFDHDQLGRRAAVQDSKVLDRFEVLRGNRLLYPDGTLAEVAKRILRLAVIIVSVGKPPRQPKAEKKDEHV
jgi:hypothetical protein